jgi:hypothetical protein
MCNASCWYATSPTCHCSCGRRNHGGAYRYRSGKSEELAKAIAIRARDEAVNRTLQKVEASTVVTQPHIAIMIEGVRQSYNHRDYLYDVVKELSSSHPTNQKVSSVRDRTVQEIKSEVVSRLASGGVTAVSSSLRDTGLFKQPFGVKGPVLNEDQENLLQTFFEGTLSQLSQEA